MKLTKRLIKKGMMYMPFRVYDTKEKKWVQNCYLNQLDDLLLSEKKKFGKEKTTLLSDNRYVWHRDIGYLDKNDNLIYEGDICNINTNKGEFVCVVVYVSSCCSYLLAHSDGEKVDLYEFYEEAKDLIEIVGNIFDTPDKIKMPHIEEDVAEEKQADEEAKDDEDGAA